MPIYMDRHIAPGVNAVELAQAHLLDVKMQDHFLCKALTYWLDEDKGCVFCLIEAPNRESVRELHEKAHGLIPNEIIQVDTDVVRAFLGRIQDPEHAIYQPQTGLKVFNDPAFRIMLITETTDTRLLQHALGRERTQELLLLYSSIVREESRAHEGTEVYSRNEGFVISFSSQTRATNCAIAIRKKLKGISPPTGLRIALHAGLPVDNDNAIFGTTIRFAQFLCTINKPGEIAMSSAVRNLFKDNDWNLTVGQDNIRVVTSQEENFLEGLLLALTKQWQNTEFDVPDFCRIMSVSKSQLYRKCVSLTGMSPNLLLREYRLLRSLDILKDKEHNISQATFDTGFSSPSYFTKCFQKRFGLQPIAYVKTRA